MAPKRKRKYKWGPKLPVTERGETLYTYDEAINYLAVSERWMRDHQHEIPYIGIGKQRRYRKSDLDAFIDSKRIPAGER
jgi:excisionase family DNA binding protein